MLLFLLALALTAASPVPSQVLAGPAFERLARRTDAACSARGVRSITPGDLDYAQEGFEQGLSRHDRARLRFVNQADHRCASRNGLSCAATATLEAIDTARLTPRFIAYICTHPDPR